MILPNKKTPQPLSRLQSIREKIGRYLPTSASSQPQKEPTHSDLSPAKTARNPDKSKHADADTKLTKKTFNLSRIFYATRFFSTNPQPNDYRLGASDTVSVTEPASLQQAFQLKNTADIDLIFVDIKQEKEDVLPFAGKEKQHCYYGKQTFRLNNTHWQPIASLSTSESITRYHVSPEARVEIRYSRRDNLYYIRSIEEPTFRS